MFKAEKILWALVVIAAVMWFFNVPGKGVLFTLILTSLSLLYYVLGFVVFNGIGFRQMIGKDGLKGLGWKRIVWGVLMGFCASLVCLGILFKIQFWPGSATMLMSGIILFVICGIAGLVALGKNARAWLKTSLLRAGLMTAIAALMFVITDIHLVSIQYRNDPELAEAWKAALNNPDNPELWNKAIDLERSRDMEEAE